ncbi:hypothetical protein A2U01_0017230, partial [Trifolium medium]|nr:hypothetical protein [Trifolium medium]
SEQDRWLVIPSRSGFGPALGPVQNRQIRAGQLARYSEQKALVGDIVLVLSFALSLDLRWKGEFDFVVEFTFSPLLFRFYMAEPTEELVENHGLVDTITDPKLDWVGSEPREIASVITPTALGLHTVVEDREEGQEKNWDVYCLTEGRRIYSEFSEDEFAMYEFVFKDLRFRFPFSHLA